MNSLGNVKTGCLLLFVRFVATMMTPTHSFELQTSWFFAFEIVLKLSLFAAPLSATNVVAVAVSTSTLNISWERPESVDIFVIKVQSLAIASHKTFKYVSSYVTTVIIDGLMTGTLYNITVRVFSAGYFSLPTPNVTTPTCKCCALSELYHKF